MMHYGNLLNLAWNHNRFEPFWLSMVVINDLILSLWKNAYLARETFRIFLTVKIQHHLSNDHNCIFVGNFLVNSGFFRNLLYWETLPHPSEMTAVTCPFWVDGVLLKKERCSRAFHWIKNTVFKLFLSRSWSFIKP